jgi:hypothetical protein
MALDIRMKRPGEQYSIYKPHTDATQGGKNPDATKPPAQTDAQPAPSQPQPK